MPGGKGLPTITSPHYGVKSLGTTSIGASEPGFKQREKGVRDRVDGVQLESKHPPFPQHTMTSSKILKPGHCNHLGYRPKYVSTESLKYSRFYGLN